MNKPIGIFDSGVGGTSIWKEIRNLLPLEDTIYLADSANAPYGPKGKPAIIDLCIKKTIWQLDEWHSRKAAFPMADRAQYNELPYCCWQMLRLDLLLEESKTID